MGSYSGWFFFALISLTRFSVQTGLLERPLVAGLIIALVTGEIFPVIYIAVFFELLWIDIIPAGTFIPPNALFCVIATMCIVHIFTLTHTSQIFPVMVMTIPLAFFFSWVESLQRTAQNKNYNIILQQSRRMPPKYTPGAMIKKSVLQMFLLNLTAGIAGIYILVFVTGLAYYHLTPSDFLSWPLLLMFASVSALAALRVKKAYITLILTMTLISVYLGWEFIASV